MKNFIRKFLPDFILDWYHFLWAFLSAVIFGFPSRKLKVIGVTGTKGKSTVVMMIGRILEEAGFKVGWSSSLSFKVGDREWNNPYHMTMPGRFFLQKLLRQMVNSGSQYAILEITSEGIKQYRHKFIDFDGAIFTNLAPEHIEAHGSLEKYREAKLELFKELEKSSKKNKFIVANLDDENSKYFLNFNSHIKKYGFTMKEANVDGVQKFAAREIKIARDGSEFLIGSQNYRLNLLGEFNLQNTLAAVSACVAQGVSSEKIAQAISKIKSIPGRLEYINEGQEFSVVVDLAHTPDSFKNILQFLRGETRGNLICVFGSAGGGRDKWKRPVLAKIAAQYCQQIILTNEDPYDENPEKILSDLEQGLIKADFKNYKKIPDRREAIHWAFLQAKASDTVAILGKGNEQTMIFAEKKIPWDDRQVVREELKKL